MADIVQLPMPLWWREPELWRERHHVSSVDRPTEDQALDNIYYQARVVCGDYRIALSELERDVDTAWQRVMRWGKSYWNDYERAQHICNDIKGLAPRQVVAIMRDIELVRHNYAMVEHALDTMSDAQRGRLLAQTVDDGTFKQALREVLHKDVQKAA